MAYLHISVLYFLNIHRECQTEEYRSYSQGAKVAPVVKEQKCIHLQHTQMLQVILKEL